MVKQGPVKALLVWLDQGLHNAITALLLFVSHCITSNTTLSVDQHSPPLQCIASREQQSNSVAFEIVLRHQGVQKRKEKTTPFGVNLMRSQVLYRAAQDTKVCMQTALLDLQRNLVSRQDSPSHNADSPCRTWCCNLAHAQVNMMSSVPSHSNTMRTYWLNWSGAAYNGSTDDGCKANPNTAASQNRLIVL